MANYTLIKTRRDFCLRYIATLTNLIEQSIEDSSKIHDVRTQFGHLPARIASFENYHAQVMAHADNKSKQDEMWEEYDSFFSDVRHIESKCNAPPFARDESLNQSTILNTAFTTTACSSSSGAHARLPKLDLPSFDGTISNWSSYYDIFVSSVHENDSLHSVQKFQYLKATLRGEPLTLIKSLPLTDANYDIAIDMLKTRYARPRLISAYHLQSLINLPKLTHMSYTNVSSFVSAVNEHVSALRAQKEPVDAWSRVLTFVLVNKLETKIRDKFESRLGSIELPELTELLSFLNTFISAQQWQTIDNIQSTASHTPAQRSQSFGGRRFAPKVMQTSHRTAFVATLKPKDPCVVCNERHLLYRCAKFLNLPLKERQNIVKTHRYCFNCLSPRHMSSDCTSTRTCRRCHQTHHTTLHVSDSVQTHAPGQSSAHGAAGAEVKFQPQHASNILVTTSAADQTPRTASGVLLSTAILRIADSNGQWHEARALLDNGSEATLITDSCRKRLHLPLRPSNTTLSGVSNLEVSAVKGTVLCQFAPRNGERTFSVSATVLNNITQNLPHCNINRQHLADVNKLDLADPTFNVPGPIDLLIGADLYFSLLIGPHRKLANGLYTFQSVFGWVVAGPIELPTPRHIRSFVSTQREELSDTLRKFWELEEVQCVPTQSDDDRLAEQIFRDHHSRTSEGRYVAPLLFKDFPPTLGKSFGPALACFRSLRNRLLNNQPLRDEYVSFMADYIDAGHMTKLDSTPTNQFDGYFIPHHCVVKSSDTARKLRVVFNASKRSSNGRSLNDELLTGPALQIDLAKIIMRQRLHTVIFTADIRQMYRQILVPQTHRQFQKILWSADLRTPPDIYQLNTVTYGTSCAPFLAIRTLQQLVRDEGSRFPEAARVLTTDTFVDDVITGSDNLQNATILKNQLIQLMSTGGMELRKWSSNHPELLADVPNEHKQTSMYSLDPDQVIKILGLIWNPSSDSFSYQIQIPESNLTKRQILSEAARIFDPLGWLSPTTIVAKQLLQQLWKLGLHWDAPLPESIGSHWKDYKSQLPHIRDIVIPRFISTRGSINYLIGFCDASERSYAAVVYIRSQIKSEAPITSLVIAKTRVAPVKQISLPRLELCAALLLSQLINVVIKTHQLTLEHIFLWSDSTVALSWIHAPSYQWKTFVANRVSQIQTLTQANWWHHVRSQDNPADCASRGIMPIDLPTHPLWWSGPTWIGKPLDQWPIKSIDSTLVEINAQLEAKPATCLVNQQQDQNRFDLFNRYSSLDTLIRTTALCLRFGRYCRGEPRAQSGHLTAVELHQAMLRLVTVVQQEEFSDTIKLIKRNLLRIKSLRKLHPFVDEAGLLRVGGRLRHSQEQYDKKHPMLLPSNHPFTNLVIVHYHERYLHPAPRTLQGIIERRFWILAARRTIRKISAKCMKCFRCNPQFHHPMMGDLPLHRVTPLKPFEVLGVDYGGPFPVTASKGRGCKSVKAYLCLFICFATKAVHLELASDLSTNAFLAAFRRLIARRGRCSHVYSDGGTNFIGARTYFSELQRFTTSTQYNSCLVNKLAADGIEWHVNPPSAPHFGGLWEAGIKSVKFHLSRVIGHQVLTYEELSTVLCEIEAILNSRPLCPISSDPHDYDALTPSHFLTHESAVCLPDPDLVAEPINRLNRWQLLQRLHQDFWKRWRHEYLNTLQQRQKWIDADVNIQPGQLVLIHDNNLPPLQWRMGRVVTVSPGQDHTVRVAKVRTSNGYLTRPVVKLAPMPMDPAPDAPA